MPSISAGVGSSYLTGNDAWDDNTNKRSMASWMVGLTWNDVLLEGNALGYAVGQPQFVYEVEDGFVADGKRALALRRVDGLRDGRGDVRPVPLRPLGE